ncbi:MAG: FAD-dependent oxidoreductase [Sphingomonadales bacterium]|nr:FAD-dependent oxidoreductase [Sphingomonadales bacterium]
MAHSDQTGPASVAVIGGGISGLSCAWLLSQSRDVTLYEAAPRLGGHSDTIEWQGVGVDNGFIVYNERTYPNLTALFAHLGVATRASDMSFAFSLDHGAFEYSGGNLRGLAAQPANLLKPSYWHLIAEILRFFRQARADADAEIAGTLGQYCDAGGYSAAFRERYLYPMAAAIWSTPALDIAAYPAQAFLRFSRNHGLLDIANRPVWRTVVDGSRSYVRRFAEALGPATLRPGIPVRAVIRTEDGVLVTDESGQQRRHDAVVLACHPDQALRLIDRPTSSERAVLGAFAYQDNHAVMHTDACAMPRRRAAWASWNYLAESGESRCAPAVTYWMNRLQGYDLHPDVFVTLNPGAALDEDKVLRRHTYRHPLFTEATLAAQKRLWSLQGQGGLWLCGAWFGSGFHEDGLQAGLAVAEAIGGVKRPWRVADESGRIFLPPASA